MMKRKLTFFLLLCNLSLLWAATPVLTWKLIETKYPTPDAIVAAYTVTDFGAVGDGETDNTLIFQTALNKLRNVNYTNMSGGVLFVPSGKYVIKGNLNIPKGVTIRGEWKKPVKGQPVEGTILMAYAGRGEEDGIPFITMEPATGIRDMAIWYPEQTPDNIVPYPISIAMGKPKHFGNEYCNVRNITLINSYTGVSVSRDVDGGGCPVFYDIFGTPLSIGIEIDNIADVGRIDRIDFSPDYWSGSGLEGSPSVNGAHKQWIYENGTGIMMRRNDWSYTCFVNIDGYKTGFHALQSRKSSSIPNGQNYELTMTNCQTAVQCDAIANVGILFARIHINNCENGFVLGAGTGGSLHLLGSDINATKKAFVTDGNISTRIMMQGCKINQGEVDVQGGIFSCTDCDFNNSAPQIRIGKNARNIITGNRFKGHAEIKNNSLFKGVIDHTPVAVKPLPEFPQIKHETQKQKPDRLVMYNVTSAPFNARPNSTTMDNTKSIQMALDQAAADGGGIVFLPTGKYRMLGNLNIPSGVELKGSLDNSSASVGPGSVLQVYAGKGEPDGTPFISMQAKSGLRGIVFDYPEQISSMLPNINEYPYCVQVQGSNVYIVNIGIRAAYRGFDLFTYKCDNHYIDYIAGHSFKTGIRVGCGSENGKICNLQYNQISYACGHESKFGSYPNSPKEGQEAAYNYSYDNLDWLVLGDCKNEILYNDFGFGSQRGVTFTKDSGSGASGVSMGLGIDGSRRSICFEALDPKGFDLINTQIVAIENSDKTANTRYIETSADFTGEATFFSSDYWGSAMQGIVAPNGTINFYAAWFSQPGQNRFGNLTGGKVNIVTSNFAKKDPLLNTGNESRFSAQSSLIDPSGININNCNLWKNNLGNAPELNIVTLDRSGWTASASKNNGNAKNAIDGNDNTRWDTQGGQIGGEWFMVDMKTPQIFSTIIFDTSNSANDSPAQYELYVSNDGISWGEAVATGKGGGMLTIINFPTQNARYFKMVQTGTKSNYWSIHEIKVVDDKGMSVRLNTQDERAAYFSNGHLFIKGFPGISDIKIFNIDGKKVFACQSSESYIPISLKSGIYMIHIQGEKGNISEKLVLNN